jgi:hypothetical protein
VKPVMLEFVNPARARRRRFGRGGQARFHKADRAAGSRNKTMPLR